MNNKTKKKIPTAFIVIGAFVFISVLLIAIGITNMSNARSAQQAATSSEHINGKVVEMKIVNSYLHPVIEYPAAGGDQRVEFQRSDLYQGQDLTLVLNGKSVSVYTDYYWDYSGSMSGFVVITIGTVIILIVLAYIIKKRVTGSYFSFVAAIMLPFLSVGLVFIAVAAMNSIISANDPSKPEANDFIQTEAVLVNVPEYEVRVEYTTDADGDKVREEHTYFFGDTVARYVVDNVIYLAKVSDSESNKDGDKITVNCSRSSPGLTSGFNSDDRWVVSLVLGIIGIVFTLIPVIGAVIAFRNKRQTRKNR